MPDEPLLQLKEISKHFSGVHALESVNFDLRPGEIHGICGANGAGKSTLMNILTGNYPAGSFEGEILLDGRSRRFREVRDSRQAGIAIIHQELHLVDEMSVGENLFLGREPRSAHLSALGNIDWPRLHAKAREVIETHGLPLDYRASIRDLGVGQRQMVEIARALSSPCRILILDEPTSALTGEEVRILMTILRKLKQQGVACVYISHLLEEVLALADRITVLRDGRNAGTDTRGALTRDELVFRMVGRKVEDRFLREAEPRDNKPVVLAVENFTVFRPEAPHRKACDNLSFTLHQGEVLGLGGLLGSGRSELALALFGEYGVKRSGTVQVAGQATTIRNAREAIGYGLGLIPEDRKKQGLVLDHALLENLTLANLRDLTVSGWIEPFKERKRAAQLAAQLGIRGPSLDSPVRMLSGGNQQKVVIAKYLNTQPRVLILDEPTRGIDVGAKQEIYQMIDELTAAGMAILLISSDLPELISLSDRILVLHQGRGVGILDREGLDPEQLMGLATGARQDEGV